MKFIFLLFLFLTNSCLWAEELKNNLNVTNDCFSKSKCPYFFDLYKNNKEFKNSLNLIFSKEKIPLFKWVGSGVSSPAEPIDINGKKYLYLNSCKPHDCSSNHLDILFDQKDNVIKGFVKINDQPHILNMLDENEFLVLFRESNKFIDSYDLTVLKDKNNQKILDVLSAKNEKSLTPQTNSNKLDEARRTLEQERKHEQASVAEQSPNKNPVVAGDNRRRFALVIGNSNYSNLPKLPNTINDERSIALSLQATGFTVSAYENLDLNGMQNAIRTFGEKLGKNDVGLVYYAGHGVQVKGKNYLIPVKENIKKSFEVPASAIDVDLILATLESVKNDLNIVILDACRSPFPGESRGASRGLATMDAAKGTFVAFATSPGKEALDGDGGNSPYTKHLSRMLSRKGLPLEQVFKEVRKAVVAETKGEQIPWENSSLMGDFYFAQ
jgi:hypothetical protein